MNIDLLKINGFGKIKNKEIELQKNINIIYGKNEQGKTTTLKFLSSILYGISKNKNGKDISDFEKYKPWDGEEYSGKIIYTLDDEKQYEVFREFNKKNPKIYNEKNEEISKDFNIDKNKGNQFFFEQTNIDEDTFYSSSLVEQKEVVLESASRRNITQKMSNIISTGEDNTSYKKTIDKLNRKYIEEVGNERTVERPLNKLKIKIENIIKKIKEIEFNETNKIEINKKKNDINLEIINLENKKNLLGKIKKIKEEKFFEEEKINIKNNLIEENKNKIDIIEKNIKENDNKNQKIKKQIIILFVIFILLNIINFFLKTSKNFKGIACGILVLIFLVSLIVRIKNQNKLKNQKIKKLNDEKNTINKIINEIKMDTDNLIKEQNEQEEIKKINLIEEYKNVVDKKFILEKYNMNLDEIEAEIKKVEEENNNLKFAKYQIEVTNENINKGIEDRLNLEEQLENFKYEEKEILELGQAINLAKEILEKSYEKMKNNITPKFTENLIQNTKNILGEKYKNIIFKEDEGLVVELESGNYVNANLLSTGTIDQMYFALRLSVMQEIAKENLPIILDETFAYYDEERLENILNYLGNNFKNNQIIIFTCTQREKEILNKLQINYNYIEL